MSLRVGWIIKIIHEWSQKPINDDHLGQVDES